MKTKREAGFFVRFYVKKNKKKDWVPTGFQLKPFTSKSPDPLSWPVGPYNHHFCGFIRVCHCRETRHINIRK